LIVVIEIRDPRSEIVDQELELELPEPGDDLAVLQKYTGIREVPIDVIAGSCQPQVQPPRLQIRRVHSIMHQA
jgi:hypothetical protein